MQKCSCQIVQEQKLKLEPHLISIVAWLLVDCGCNRDRPKYLIWKDLEHESMKKKSRGLLHDNLTLRYQCTPNDHRSSAPLYGRTVDANPTKVYIF